MLGKKLHVPPLLFMIVFAGAALQQAYYMYLDGTYPRRAWIILMQAAIAALGLVGFVLEKRNRRPFLVPAWVPLVLLGIPASIRLVMELVEPGPVAMFPVAMFTIVLLALVILIVQGLRDTSRRNVTKA